MRIVSVNVGKAVDADWAGSLKRTAIDKRPVAEPVAVAPNGLAGDERADLENHGSPHQAIYAYAREDLDWWADQLGIELRDGIFGENLTTAQVDVTNALIGEQWRIGTVYLEVTSPRIPCGVFRNWMNIQGWVKRFTRVGRPGAYFQVLKTGKLAAGDEIAIVHRPDSSVTIAESFRAYHGDKELMRRLSAVPGLSSAWHEAVERVLGTA